MSRQKTWSALRRLTRGIARSLKHPSTTAVTADPPTPKPSPTHNQSCKTTPTMADEEDYSSLPLTDRWVHKIWKVRKQAYEDATKQFELTASEHDPAFRPFLLDSSLWKGAVADSNVAAQQDGIAAYCAFLKYGSKEHATRTRGITVTPLCEKGLPSTRAAAKTASLEALLLLCELDVPGPVLEEMLPVVSAKQPKTVAAVLNALTQIFHNYGCKTADPKPVLKVLPKVFGHADKNVRAEATNLAVEFYRWLREAMKPMFWGDLKSTQQSDLEAQFEKIKAEGAPKQERLLRTQQAAKDKAPAAGAGDDEGEEDSVGGEPEEIDAFDLAEPQDVAKAIPGDFYDRLGSSKWKDRKEALEALYALVNVPRIKDGDFNEVNRVLAKSMKDANIAVVTQAAQCIELLAKGLRKGYAKYRSTVMQPIMERLKEKKVTVADALGAALDAVFATVTLTDCIEDILAFLVHKNPQVKEGTMKFLVRCLRTTRDVPTKAEIGQIVEAAKKLLAESSPVLREGGAEILGTIMKIIGERAMNPHLEGLDDIRKGKVRDFYETAEVKAKEKPKAPPPAPKAAPAKKIVGGGARKVVKKPAAAPARSETPPPAAPPAAKSKLGLTKPSGLGGLKAPQKKIGLASPRRPAAVAPPPPEDEYEEPSPEPVVSPPRPRMGLGRGGLAGRSLAKPVAASAALAAAAEPTPAPSGLNSIERAELEDLRDANDRLMRTIEDGRHERSKLLSEIQELKNQNAGLIEDHTRDVLSIKAKETQLVRARSDAEAAEGTNERLRRELDRLKRALGKAEQLGVSREDVMSPSLSGMGSPTRDEWGGRGGGGQQRQSYASTHSDEKENGGGDGPPAYARHKALSPELGRYGNGNGGVSGPNSGRVSPAARGGGMRSVSDTAGGNGNGNGVESWKRAAEVTSQLKARIEQMKVSSCVSNPHPSLAQRKGVMLMNNQN